MTTPSECRCNQPEIMGHAGHILALCHHSTHPDVMDSLGKLYDIMNTFDRRLEIEQLLTRPANEAIEYYMRTLMGSDYAMLNQTERDILTVEFLRQYCIALQIMLRENLNNIKTREQG